MTQISAALRNKVKGTSNINSLGTSATPIMKPLHLNSIKRLVILRPVKYRDMCKLIPKNTAYS